jgi:predicted 3-demethylubiquinone-9 3-methyltransferase (glyoxalase superfamily)
MTMSKQTIKTFLWFNGNAEAAANHYVSIFKNSKITAISRYGEGAPMPKGTVLTVAFELDGQEFLALNGGPQHKFTEAISLLVQCESQEEVDAYWSKLTAGGGQEGPCGWLKDKFGLSWQVVPSRLGQLMTDQDAAKSTRVMQAMMQMKKLDIAGLERAYSQG